MNREFWELTDRLIADSTVRIDRPRGSAHPRYPHVIYPLDYGYLENTQAIDGSGIDLWRGSLSENTVTGVICTVDALKRDAEIKLLIGCTEEEQQVALDFHNDSQYMKGILIKRTK